MDWNVRPSEWRRSLRDGLVPDSHRVLRARFQRNLEPGELRLMTEHRWWLVDDLLRSAERFAPAGIGHLLADLIEKGPPRTTVETGP